MAQNRTMPFCVAFPLTFTLILFPILAHGADDGYAHLRKLGIGYKHVVLEKPVPLQIHQITVDLLNQDIEIASVVADDPDGDGPADAALTAPMDLAKKSEAIVLVNTNPFAPIPGKDGDENRDWFVGKPVKIHELAVADGRQANPWNRPNEAGFWIAKDGSANIGRPEKIGDVRDGVGGFSIIVRNGEAVKTGDGQRHPRTALGLDKDRKSLCIIVADGRQNGYSEGMTIDELAAFMKDAGCIDAINLDGGGSSIMILADENGALEIVNSPSTKVLGISFTRPLPNALVVRRKKH